MKPSEILLAARELVAARHVTGRMSDRAGGFCTIGAIWKIGDDWESCKAARDFVQRVIGGRQYEGDVHDASTHLENVVRLEKAVLLAMSEGQ